MLSNFASPISFSFVCDKIPLTLPTIQQITVPSITLGSANIPNPFTKISQPGNIEYGPLSLNFKILEDYSNYLEIVEWLNELGHPNNLNQFKDNRIDAFLLPQTSTKKTALRIKIEDIQPSFISIPQYDTTLTELTYLNASVTFDFTSLKFIRADDIGC
jgi:hypothetical protein